MRMTTKAASVALLLGSASAFSPLSPQPLTLKSRHTRIARSVVPELVAGEALGVLVDAAASAGGLEDASSVLMSFSDQVISWSSCFPMSFHWFIKSQRRKEQLAGLFAWGATKLATCFVRRATLLDSE